MSNSIEFTDDELALLHLLLTRELESSRVELHHTAGLPYRQYIQERMEQGQALLQKLNAVSADMQLPDAGRPQLAFDRRPS